MRIMFYISSMGSGGAERVVSTISNYLAGVGHEIEVASLTPAAGDFYRLDPRVARVALGLESPAASAWGRLLDSVRRAWRLRREIRRFRPQVVVAMVDVSNVLLAFAGLGLKDLVTIGSERSYPPLTAIDRHWAWLRKWTYGWLDGVVAQSVRTCEWLRLSTRTRGTWVIPNPVALPLDSREPARDPQAVRRRRKRMLAVGRCRPQKGFDLLIEAFAAQPQAHDEWELVILGDGPERTNLESLVTERRLGQVVTFAGLAGNVSDWYASADLFVLSSRFEGFPNVLLEAMAHGLPVVAFDCLTGPRELLEDGSGGILVPAENVEELSAALGGMFSDERRRIEYARKSLQVSRKYAVENISAQWLEVFEESLRRKRAAG